MLLRKHVARIPYCGINRNLIEAIEDKRIDADFTATKGAKESSYVQDQTYRIDGELEASGLITVLMHLILKWQITAAGDSVWWIV